MKKGFYFSMDAVMALLVMSGSMMLVLQLSDSTSSEFSKDSSRYQEASKTSRDAMKLASVQKLSSLNENYTEQFKPTIDDSDMEKSVLNGISLLWANGNKTKAEELTEKYFTTVMPEKYDFRLIFNEDRGENMIYRTKQIEGSPNVITSVSTFVSGHRVNTTSEVPRIWGPANLRLVVWNEE